MTELSSADALVSTGDANGKPPTINDKMTNEDTRDFDIYPLLPSNQNGPAVSIPRNNPHVKHGAEGHTDIATWST